MIGLIQVKDVQESEEIQLKTNEISDYIKDLKQPISYFQLKEKFQSFSKEELLSQIEKHQILKNIGVIFLYLPKDSKARQVKLEYQQSVELSLKEEEIKEVKEKQLVQSKEQNENNNLEEITDEELVEWEQKLIQKKDILIIEKHRYLSGKDLLKAVQHFNQIKEMTSSVLSRLAEMQRKTLKEVCEDYDLDLNLK